MSRGAEAVGDRLRRGMMLAQAGELERAEAICRAVLRDDPDQVDALHILGLVQHQRGRIEEAARLLRRVVALAPAFADGANNLGNVLKLTGDLGEAESCYRRVVAMRPGHAGAWSNLGALLRARGDLAGAETACRRALEADPRHVAACNNLGNVLGALGRHEEAVACYRAAIGFDPSHPDGPRLLGLALAAFGRLIEAREVYRAWLGRVPGHPVAAHMLAACAGASPPPRASDAYIRTVFDGLAADFDAHLARLEYRAPALVGAAVAAALGEGSGAACVLDAGCGTGLCAPFLRPHAARLVGVDLSSGMLARADRLGLYDELTEAELTAHLRARPRAYDLIASADTLCYFGPLEDVLTAAAQALRPSGRLIFTVERAEDAAAPEGFRLAPHGRYAHAERYVRDALERAGLCPAALAPVVLRNEGGAAVAGLVATAELG